MKPLDRLFERDPKAKAITALEEHHASLETIRIEPAVPKRVKRLIETVRNLSLYARDVGIALRRAARTARKIARMHGTPIYVFERAR